MKPSRALFVVALLVSPALALAQPMMPNPSAMSGIPRPDPSVPPGKLVVRVIRVDFAHPVVGAEVTLDGEGGKKTARVGSDGHANFEGMVLGGPYTVSATSGAQVVTSQPIEMPGEAGVKVMLVFAPDAQAELGQHDGEARPDPALPAGALRIQVVGDDERPLAGLPVILAHGVAAPAGATPKIEQTPLTTNANGEVDYTGTAGSAEGFMASVKKDLLSAKSQPFQLDARSGMRLGLRATAVSHDVTQLVIGRKSHVILEVKDELVEVQENFFVENRGSVPVDLGKDGIVFKLPSGAESAQVVGEAAPGLTVSSDKAVLRGSLGPGETAVSIGFVLPQKDEGVELSQVLPLRMEQLVAITNRFPGMELRGDGLVPVERELGGRSFYVITGAPVAREGTMRLGLRGLPHRSPMARFVAVAAAAVVGLWALFAAIGGAGGRPDERTRLENEKRGLLDELAALERSKAGSAKAEAKQARRSAELMEKLERVMRELDDQGE